MEHMTDGRVRVAFESGEEHRYKPSSLHKLMLDDGTAAGQQKSRRRMSACYGWNADTEHSRDRPGRKTEARGDATTRCSGLRAELHKDQQRCKQGQAAAGQTAPFFAGRLKARVRVARKSTGQGAEGIDFVAV